MLVIGIFVVAAANVLWRLRLVVVPVALAVLVTTFLTPPTRWLKDRGFAEAPAALTVLLAAVVIVAGLGLLLVPPVVDQFEELDIGISDGIDRVQKWLVESPLPLSHEEIASAIHRLQSQLSDSLSVIADRIVSGAVVVLEVVVGLVLTAVVVRGARWWSSRPRPQGTPTIWSPGPVCCAESRRAATRPAPRWPPSWRADWRCGSRSRMCSSAARTRTARCQGTSART